MGTESAAEARAPDADAAESLTSSMMTDANTADAEAPPKEGPTTTIVRMHLFDVSAPMSECARDGSLPSVAHFPVASEVVCPSLATAERLRAYLLSENRGW